MLRCIDSRLGEEEEEGSGAVCEQHQVREYRMFIEKWAEQY